MMASLAANLNGMRWLRVSSFLVALAWLFSATPRRSLAGQAPATTVAAAGSAAFQWKKPAWAPTPAVPADNPMSVAKVWLGRRLFYDKRLSVNGTLACASCHQQAHGFTDGQPTHPGATGEPGVRSVMTLTNVAYLPSYTWANPLINSLEKQMLIPLFSDHPLEMAMGGHEAELFARLAADAEYPREFAEAFPHEEARMDVAHITKAIAAFERTILSFDSPYDRYKHGDANAISASAKRGEALFFGERLECYHCHDGINFTDNYTAQGLAFPETGFHNTGLYNEDSKGEYKPWDHGLRDVTSRVEDEGAFRTPTLRNIAVTAPYMHDGSLPTLRAVIQQHYAVKGHAALSSRGPNPLRSEFIEGFAITESEVRDLVAFLDSLTDQNFMTNPGFADPAGTPGASEKRRQHAGD
jgi:cytochrome c peroxidase